MMKSRIAILFVAIVLGSWREILGAAQAAPPENLARLNRLQGRRYSEPVLPRGQIRSRLTWHHTWSANSAAACKVLADKCFCLEHYGGPGILSAELVLGGDTYFALKNCSHGAHPACISAWINQIDRSKTCPTCRADIHPHDQQALNLLCGISASAPVEQRAPGRTYYDDWLQAAVGREHLRSERDVLLRAAVRDLGRIQSLQDQLVAVQVERDALLRPSRRNERRAGYKNKLCAFLGFATGAAVTLAFLHSAGVLSRYKSRYAS